MIAVFTLPPEPMWYTLNRAGACRRFSWLRKAAWGLGGVLLLLGAAFQLATRVIALPTELQQPVVATTTVRDIHGEILAIVPTSSARVAEPCSLGEMGKWLPAATVALEDHRFLQHGGIDWRAMAGAAKRNVRAGRIVAGGSTITQQLIKLCVHRTKRSWWSKLYEAVAAVRLEREWSKERIIEEYLNRLDYGSRHIGPMAAARLYFNKPLANLTQAQAIYLAGLPQAPTSYNPLRHPVAAAGKYHRSIERLATLRLVQDDERSRLQAVPRLSFNLPPARQAPHFVDALLAAHPKLPGGGLESTLDLRLQSHAQRQVELCLDRLASRSVSQAAVVVMDATTGDIRAMVGSRDYGSRAGGQINGCLEYRSCGSTLKPFLYLCAFDERVLTAASILPDTPDAVRAQYSDYDPANYSNHYWGPVRVREALANSLNVPAVVALSRLGARTTFHALQNFGFHFGGTFEDYGAGLILGNAEIRLLDLTSAFTAFANEGIAVEARYLRGVASRHRLLGSVGATAILADILSDNSARMKAFGSFSPLAFEGARIPCKTGTSAGFRDAWTVGATKEHCVGVWVGNFNAQNMQEIAAVTSAAPLWHGIIEYLLQAGDHSVPPPTAEKGLYAVDICKLTGHLPAPASKERMTEWFLPGTEPTTTAVDSFGEIDGKVRLLLSPEYSLWCHSALNYLDARVRQDGTLRIVSPRPGSKYLIDTSLPESKQSLRLVATQPDVTWKVNGKPISQESGLYLWQLQKGSHRVEAAGDSMDAESVFTVE